MRLGIMQPYFFPYIGYFQLISAVDEWVVFDSPQYIRKGWVNRNRVLKKNGGVKYIGITVQKCPQQTPINQVRIANYDWKTAILNDLDHYKSIRAPYYHDVITFLENCFVVEGARLSDALIRFMVMCCDYLEIQFRYKVFSEINMKIENVNEPGDWALEISNALRADTYINPPGGKGIFDKHKFESAGIRLQFIEPRLVPYDQKNGQFESGLSIIDVMMFNSPAEIKKLLAQYELT